MIEREAFERFYTASQPRLQSFLQRLCGAREVAEELAQEAYYRFLRSPFRGTSEEESRRYLYRIALNLARSRWARRQEETQQEAFVTGDPSASVDVARVLARMSPRDRALLWLAYVEESTHREIAEVMGVGALSVRVLLSRAKKRFVKLMEGKR